MQRTGAAYSDVKYKTTRHVFSCPDAYQYPAKSSTMLGAYEGANNYTAHPRLMPQLQRRAAERSARERTRRRKSPRPLALKKKILESKRMRGEIKRQRGRIDI